MSRALSLVLVLALASIAPALAADPPPFTLENADDPVLVVETSQGEFVVELFAREAPKTVANFVGLALGTKEFKDPRTGEMVRRPYYDGLAFHRVIRDFMIQGGCPLGTGTGGPGYTFEDEINAKGLGLDALKAVDISQPAGPRPHPWLLIQSQQDFQRLILAPVFEQLGIRTNEQAQARQADVQAAVGRLTVQDVYAKMGYRYDDTLTSRKPTKGTLAMANAGPNTNGSQFFVNLVDNDYLTGKHTVFGKVVKGMDVVESIGAVAVGEGGRPVEPVTIRKVRAWKAD